jgi:predicted phage terminase large subunit-like protein
VLILDDPVKDREAAESETYRSRAWDWWESVALTRLAPGGIVVLIMTRWHESDLAGQILSKPSPLRWRTLTIPAIAEDAHTDPLERAVGEEFPSVRGREPGHFARIRAGISPYVFAGLYQQRPAAAEGNFFRRAAFRYWRPVQGVPDPGALLSRGVMAGAWLELEGLRVDLADPAVWRFATCDVAASTKTSADYTVIGVWAIDREGNLILLDLARGHVEMSDHFAMARPLRDKWRFDVLYVERQFYSQTLVIDAKAAGMPVAEVVADTDKVTRAIPAAGRLHAGKAWFPADAPWLETWTSELCAFPAGTHDDQVDVFSYAARIAAAHWTPAPPPSRPPSLPPELARIEQAFSAATGNGNGHPGSATDLMNIPLG